MTLYPGSLYFFHLSPHSLIMNPSQPLTSHVLDKKRLGSIMMKKTPVVPPDSVIKTFSHLAPEDVNLIITQDEHNLCPASFIVRRGDWAEYFLDAWFDPLYRSYKFAKAEVHALVRRFFAYIKIHKPKLQANILPRTTSFNGTPPSWQNWH